MGQFYLSKNDQASRTLEVEAWRGGRGNRKVRRQNSNFCQFLDGSFSTVSKPILVRKFEFPQLLLYTIAGFSLFGSLPDCRKEESNFERQTNMEKLANLDFDPT